MTNIIQEIIYYIIFIISRILGLIPSFRKWFEREPQLTLPPINSQNFIISPANGKITNISEVNGYYRIYMFIGLFDIHTQYYPISGTIIHKEHIKGNPLQFAGNIIQYPAFTVKSENNEQYITVIKNSRIGEIRVIQIAGILANRIINYNQVNDIVKQGQPLGRIILGSSVILYIPKNKVKLLANVHQKVKPYDLLAEIY